MRKIAWPWIGTTEHEMGSDSASGDFTDKEEGSHAPPDGLSVGKSVLEDQDTGIHHENGVMSPVADVSFADDESKDKASVEISDEDDLPLANFSCHIAKDFQDKVAGLQPYKGLRETAGLIFPYKRAEDVVYHMGTVSFPIDIIFVGANDKIKKIYKNIQPGTLGTFGCANVKNVLEICGGLSDRLGIDVGKRVSISPGKNSELPSVTSLNKISSQIGIKKDIIIQYSNIFRGGFHNWNGYPILSVSDNLNKNASSSETLVSDLVRNFTSIDNREIYAFDFDGLIEESPMVRVYKTSEVVEDEVPFIRIDGHTVSIDKTDEGNDIYRDVHLHELMNSGTKKGESILASLNKSFAYFLPDNEILSDASKIFDEVRHAAHDSNSRVIIVTRSPNPDYLKAMVTTRLNLQFGERIELDVVKVSKEADVFDIADTLKKVCGNYDMKIFSDSSLLKRSGTPVPDEVKTRAKRAYKLLDAASENAKESLENMNKNLAEYGKIKTDSAAIARSKGQYNQSVRSNTRLVRGYLIKIRDAIKIFNEIKDISTTTEVIDGLASSAKQASDSVEEIFDLIDQIDSPDFHMLLSEKVGEYDKMVEDLNSSLKRGMEYINSDILGLLVLSD